MFASLLGGTLCLDTCWNSCEVRGVGFYDFNHGQRGRSANCIELHPIVSISADSTNKGVRKFPNWTT
jgi:hypothetical protein